MGGGGSPPSNTTSQVTNKFEPYDEAVPFLEAALGGIDQLYGNPETDLQDFSRNALGRVTQFDPATEQALAGTEYLGQRGNPLIGQGYTAADATLARATDALTNTPDFGVAASNLFDGDGIAQPQLSGADQALLAQYGDPAADTDALTQAISDAVINQTNSEAARLGAFDSGSHGYAMTKGLGDALAPILFQSQQDSLQRGAQLADAASGRAQTQMNNIFGFASDQYGAAPGMIGTGIQSGAGLFDEEAAGLQLLAQAGGIREGLANAEENAPYDALNQYAGLVSALSGAGGSTAGTSSSQNSGGFGLSQGLGAALGLGTLGALAFA